MSTNSEALEHLQNLLSAGATSLTSGGESGSWDLDRVERLLANLSRQSLTDRVNGNSLETRLSGYTDSFIS